MTATAAQQAAELSEQEGDKPSAIHQAAVTYAEHGWPVLPGSTWNGRRFVIPSTLKVTDGLRPAVARNQASSDIDTVTRWWSAGTPLEPSVLLRSGEAFNLVSVAFELAQTVIGKMEPPRQVGPVLYRPEEGRAYFLVQSGHVLSGEFGKPGEVVAVAPGEWVPAPPTRTGNNAHVRWWLTPDSASWCLTDVAVLAEALAAACAERLAPTREG